MALQAPINYALDIQSPFQAAAQGYQFGSQVRADQQAQEDRVAAQQAAQAKAEQDAAFAAEVQAVLANPTAEGYARIGTLDPKNAEAYQKSFATWDKAKKDSALGEGMKILAALDSGNIKVAQEMMNEKAAALRNDGNEQEAKSWEDSSKAMEMNPDGARAVLGGMLYTLGGKEFVEGYGKLRTMPADVQKAESEAVTAGAKAKYAESEALLDLEKKGWDIKSLQSDIETKRSNARIYAINAAIARETNALKRQELTLKLSEAQRARDAQIAERAAEASSVIAGIEMMESTADRLLASPGLSSALGTVESRLPTLSEDTANAEALIENLGSQAFLTQVAQMKGTGALSDAEGKKISAALQNLNTNQSEKQFRQNVGIIKEVLAASKERTRKKYGAPVAGSSLDSEIESLINQYLPPEAPP